MKLFSKKGCAYCKDFKCWSFCANCGKKTRIEKNAKSRST